ncbi:DUF6381 family protein [Streptomyces sp. NPDC059176]|uniref:DUF6381 family protein n=1 Tax=unclassified Streptomyces TaxID=2593676 RepID=UPI0036739F79
MNTAGEPVRTAEQLRVMAEELTRGADRCNDPEHRARLRRKAEELRRQCDDGTDLGEAPATPGPAPAHHHPHQQQRGPRGAQRPQPERPRGA